MPLFSRGSRLYLIVLFTLLGGVLSPLESGAISPPGSSGEKPWAAVGRDLLEKGEYGLAIAHFNKQLGLAGIGDRDRLEMFRYLAILYCYTDRNQEAIDSCRRARDLASSLSLLEEKSASEAEVAVQEYYASAQKLRALGNLSGSNLHFEEALLKSRALGNKVYEQIILRSWSLNYLGSRNTMGKYLDLNIQALNLAQSLNHRVESGRAARNIGGFYLMKSDYSHALSYFLMALSYIRELSVRKDAIFCLNNIAIVYITLGDFDKALDYITEALKRVDPENPGPIQFSLLINLGQTFQALAREFQEPRYYSRALECFSSYLKLENNVRGMDISLHALNGMAGIY